jgi:hypothetical protein
MALIHVHKIMIGVALTFCALFSVRCMVLGETTIGLIFSGTTIGLGLYFWWFLAVKSGELLDSRTGDDAE